MRLQRSSGLVGHWKFNEKSGIIANDSSRYRNTGTLVGATHLPVWADKGIKFDGVDDYITLGSQYTFTLNNTLSFWGKINPQNYLGIVSGATGGFDYLRFGQGAETFDDIIFGETSTNDDNIILPFNSPITVGTFYYFVIVEDGSKVWRLYVNGNLQSATCNTTNSNLIIKRIGEGRKDLDRFNGSLDEVRIYNRALSANEIKRHYDSTKHNYI